MQYTRELLDIIADEIIDEQSSTVADARAVASDGKYQSTQVLSSAGVYASRRARAVARTAHSVLGSQHVLHSRHHPQQEFEPYQP